MSRACPNCGEPMVSGFLQTGGGTAAFVREPRMMLLREESRRFSPACVPPEQDLPGVALSPVQADDRSP